MELDHSDVLLEEIRSLKKRLKEQSEELADSKKVLKQEIFKRWRAEEALLESELRWQFALEGAGDGLWDWNVKSKEVFFSM